MYRIYFIGCSFINIFEKNKSYERLNSEYMKPVKGGGVHPDFFVKLGFEIAVDQQTKTGDQTFEGVPDSQPPIVALGAATPIFGPNQAQFSQIP